MDVAFRSTGPPHAGHGHIGHAHFWERALSRGQFLRTAAGATGAALGAGLWLPALTQAAPARGVLANPIPGGIYFLGPGTELFHVSPGSPGPSAELSTITDFHGLIGAAHLQGPAIQTLADGTTTTLYADYDMRFMKGLYIGVDGRPHQGTFSFF